MALINPNKGLHHTHWTVKASWPLDILSEEKLAQMWNCVDSSKELCALVTKSDGIARLCYKDMCFKLKQNKMGKLCIKSTQHSKKCSNYYTLCIKNMQQVKHFIDIFSYNIWYINQLIIEFHFP